MMIMKTRVTVVHGNLSCCGQKDATNRLGGTTTTLVSRAMLATRWVLGGILLVGATPRWPWLKRGRRSSVGRLPAIFALWWFLPTGLLCAASVQVAGEYTYEWWWPPQSGKTNTVHTTFNAWIGKNALKISTLSFGEKACQHITFIDQKVQAEILDCRTSGPQKGGLTVELDSADAAWALGNCRGNDTSCLFLALRCSELFPAERTERLLSSPAYITSEALALVTEARYSFSGKNGADLFCDLVVQSALRSNWKMSPFLRVSALDPERLKEETRRLAEFPDGFVSTSIHFTKFTNIAGFRLPTVTQFTLFSPSPARQANTKSVGASLTATAQVVLTKVEQSVDDTISFLPINGATFSVSDGRLEDRKLHVKGGVYETNQLVTFDITPAARAAFEVEVQRARALRRTEQTKRLLITILAAVVLGVPVAVYFLQKRRLPKIKAGSIRGALFVLILGAVLQEGILKSEVTFVRTDWKAHFSAKFVVKDCVFEEIIFSSGKTNFYHARYQDNAFLLREIQSPEDAALDHISGGGSYAAHFGSNYWAIEAGRALKLFPNADNTIKEFRIPEVMLIDTPRRKLVGALFYGFHLFDPRSVEWLSESTFKASSFSFMNLTFHGEIREAPGGLPTVIEWHADPKKGSQPTDLQFTTECNYLRKLDDLPHYPSEITVSGNLAGKSVLVAKYSILSLQTSQQALTADSFDSKHYFWASTPWEPQIIMFTNDQAFFSNSSGGWQKIIAGPLPDLVPGGVQHTKLRNVIVLGFVVLLVIPALFAWRHAKKQRS